MIEKQNLEAKYNEAQGNALICLRETGLGCKDWKLTN